jgi:hypothetical protein
MAGSDPESARTWTMARPTGTVMADGHQPRVGQRSLAVSCGGDIEAIARSLPRNNDAALTPLAVGFPLETKLRQANSLQPETRVTTLRWMAFLHPVAEVGPVPLGHERALHDYVGASCNRQRLAHRQWLGP